jgi:hypothetical protein
MSNTRWVPMSIPSSSERPWARGRHITMRNIITNTRKKARSVRAAYHRRPERRNARPRNKSRNGAIP